MSNPVIETGNYRNLTSNTLIKTGPGAIMGIFVASASATPTIKVWDSTTATGNVLVNTFTPVGGTFYPIPAAFGTGLFISIGGTVDCTVFWDGAA